MSIDENDILIMRSRKPALPADAFRRSGANAVFDDGNSSIITVSAPAGSGKTFAISQWLDENANCACIWITVEPDAHDGERFWSHVSFAVEQAFPDVSTLSVRQGLPRRGSFASISLLLNVVTRQRKPFVMVFDNTENITGDLVWQDIGFLCDNIPQNGRVVLSGRMSPQMPLSRMSIGRHVRRVGFTQLAFDEVDLNRLVNVSKEAGAKPNAAELQEASGGWPSIAVAMLQTWCASSLDFGSQLNSHADSLAIDFIEEEVLANLPAESIRFLALASLLPVITENECRQVIGAIDESLAEESHVHIDFLYRKCSILERSIGRGYICNPVIAKFLQARLKDEDEASFRAAHRTLAHKFKERGKPIEAIEHAVEGELWDDAVGLIMASYSSLGMSSEFVKLHKWLSCIPEQYFEIHPELNIAQAMALIPFGQNAQTEALLARAERLLLARGDEGPLSDDGFMVYCEVPIIRAYNAAFAMGGGDDLLFQSAFARERLGTNRSRAIEGSVTLMDGVGAMLQGDYDAAEVCFESELEHLDGEGALFTPMLAAFYLIMLRYQRGQLNEAKVLAERAISRAQQDKEAYREGEGLIYILLALILYDLNEVEECLNHAVKGISRVREWGAPLMLSDGYEVLHYANEALHGTEYPRVSPIHESAANEKPALFAHLSIKKKRYRSFVGNGAGYDEPSSDLWRLWSKRKEAQALIEKSEWQSCETLLGQIADEARQKKLWGYVVEAQAMRALVSDKRGYRESAYDALQEALAIAEKSGHVRVFVDEGDPMRKLLAEVRKQTGSARIASRLLKLFSTTAEIRDHDPLSPREHEVLELLVQGFVPKEISAQLCLSVGTVRTHLHHIYEKLDVGSQREAVSVAHLLGLTDDAH